jgi:hypothetical protein
MASAIRLMETRLKQSLAENEELVVLFIYYQQ